MIPTAEVSMRASSPGLFLTSALALLAGCSVDTEGPTFKDDGGTLHGDDGGEGTGGGEGGSGGTDDTATGEELAPLQASCTAGEAGSADPLPSMRLTSTVTWTLDFDADAEAGGAEDCSYTRTYEGLQRFGREHLCPDCSFITVGTATMTEGVDCYAQISSTAETARDELWGISNGTEVRRAGRAQYPLGAVLATLDTASGDGSPVPVAWESGPNALTSGGTFDLTATGHIAWELDETTLQDDPWAPRPDAYACGWECEDPGDLVGTAPLALGETIPNGRFQDVCGDTVDLWDFHGSYLVIDASQSDCGPCRSMAQTEHAFVQQMRAAGVPVRVVTLMGNGLSATYETPSADTLSSWVDTYGVDEPVLADTAWTLSFFPSFIQGYSGEDYGYPAWIVVDPELRPIHGNVGFSSWDSVAEVVMADVEGRRRRASAPVGAARVAAESAPGGRD